MFIVFCTGQQDWLNGAVLQRLQQNERLRVDIGLFISTYKPAIVAHF